MEQALLSHAPGTHYFIYFHFKLLSLLPAHKLYVFICFSSVVSPLPSCPQPLSPTGLSVQPVSGCLEGLGMASALMSPGQVLLTGGWSRGGRGAVIRRLIREKEGWRSVSEEPSEDLGERHQILF